MDAAFADFLRVDVANGESRRLHEVVLDIRRRRAARLGLPEPKDVPAPAFPPGMSLGDMIRAARERRPLVEAAQR
jgi:hypothetical protein